MGVLKRKNSGNWKSVAPLRITSWQRGRGADGLRTQRDQDKEFVSLLSFCSIEHSRRYDANKQALIRGYNDGRQVDLGIFLKTVDGRRPDVQIF